VNLKGKPWGRLAAEFGVIFLSIILALIADDWRETRSERQDGLDSLELILEDLHEEESGLDRFQEVLTEQVAAAAELIRILEERGDPGEIARAYSRVVLYFNYESAHPAYRGLAESGGLRLIEDAAVRDAIIDYHDGTIPYLQGLRLTMEEDAQTLARIGYRHFIRRPDPGGDGQSSLDRAWGFRLETSPAELRADREFMGALGAAGATARFLAARIDGRFLERNRETIRVVQDYLTGVGR